MPQTYAQARASSDWPQIKAAMHEEIEKLDRYGVWEVVDSQKGMSVLDARWVYTQKPWKALWVAKGFRQVEGLHYDKLESSYHLSTDSTLSATKSTLYPPSSIAHCRKKSMFIRLNLAMSQTARSSCSKSRSMVSNSHPAVSTKYSTLGSN
jgi:hypothetical protein